MSCIACGELREISGQNIARPMPDIALESRHPHGHENIAEVSQRFIAAIREKFSEISEMRSIGKGWPEITNIFGFECGKATVQRHHGRMERGEI